jgi:hypothetical protein
MKDYLTKFIQVKTNPSHHRNQENLSTANTHITSMYGRIRYNTINFYCSTASCVGLRVKWIGYYLDRTTMSIPAPILEFSAIP